MYIFIYLSICLLFLYMYVYMQISSHVSSNPLYKPQNSTHKALRVASIRPALNASATVRSFPPLQPIALRGTGGKDTYRGPPSFLCVCVPQSPCTKIAGIVGGYSRATVYVTINVPGPLGCSFCPPSDPLFGARGPAPWRILGPRFWMLNQGFGV